MSEGGTQPGSALQPAFFSVRLVSHDMYMSQAVPGFDVTGEGFSSFSPPQVPVIRLFGSTPAGQKTCLHVHGVFPYFYLYFEEANTRNMEPEDITRYIAQLQGSLDRALDVSLGRTNEQGEPIGRGHAGKHVFRIVLVRGRPFYGYEPLEKYFLKVYLYSPFMVSRAVGLLQTGAVMGCTYQPYEAHVPYLLQFCMDFNIYPMNLVHLGHVMFRGPFVRRTPANPVRCVWTGAGGGGAGGSQESQQAVSTPYSREKVWHLDELSEEHRHPLSVVRQSVCELEVDAIADSILNRLEIDPNRYMHAILGELDSGRIGSLGVSRPPTNAKRDKLVHSLAQIWEDEKFRRRERNKPTQLTPPPSQARPPSDLFDIQHRLYAKLDTILGMVQSQSASQLPPEVAARKRGEKRGGRDEEEEERDREEMADALLEMFAALEGNEDEIQDDIEGVLSQDMEMGHNQQALRQELEEIVATQEGAPTQQPRDIACSQSNAVPTFKEQQQHARAQRVRGEGGEAIVDRHVIETMGAPSDMHMVGLEEDPIAEGRNDSDEDDQVWLDSQLDDIALAFMDELLPPHVPQTYGPPPPVHETPPKKKRHGAVGSGGFYRPPTENRVKSSEKDKKGHRKEVYGGRPGGWDEGGSQDSSDGSIGQYDGVSDLHGGPITKRSGSEHVSKTDMQEVGEWGVGDVHLRRVDRVNDIVGGNNIEMDGEWQLIPQYDGPGDTHAPDKKGNTGKGNRSQAPADGFAGVATVAAKPDKKRTYRSLFGDTPTTTPQPHATQKTSTSTRTHPGTKLPTSTISGVGVGGSGIDNRPGSGSGMGPVGSKYARKLVQSAKQPIDKTGAVDDLLVSSPERPVEIGPRHSGQSHGVDSSAQPESFGKTNLAATEKATHENTPHARNITVGDVGNADKGWEGRKTQTARWQQKMKDRHSPRKQPPPTQLSRSTLSGNSHDSHVSGLFSPKEKQPDHADAPTAAIPETATRPSANEKTEAGTIPGVGRKQTAANNHDDRFEVEDIQSPPPSPITHIPGTIAPSHTLLHTPLTFWSPPRDLPPVWGSPPLALSPTTHEIPPYQSLAHTPNPPRRFRSSRRRHTQPLVNSGSSAPRTQTPPLRKHGSFGSTKPAWDGMGWVPPPATDQPTLLANTTTTTTTTDGKASTPVPTDKHAHSVATSPIETRTEEHNSAIKTHALPQQTRSPQPVPAQRSPSPVPAATQVEQTTHPHPLRDLAETETTNIPPYNAHESVPSSECPVIPTVARTEETPIQPILHTVVLDDPMSVDVLAPPLHHAPVDATISTHAREATTPTVETRAEDDHTPMHLDREEEEAGVRGTPRRFMLHYECVDMHTPVRGDGQWPVLGEPSEMEPEMEMQAHGEAHDTGTEISSQHPHVSRSQPPTPSLQHERMDASGAEGSMGDGGTTLGTHGNLIVVASVDHPPAQSRDGGVNTSQSGDRRLSLVSGSPLVTSGMLPASAPSQVHVGASSESIPSSVPRSHPPQPSGVLRFARRPPTLQQLRASMQALDVPEVIYKQPYYETKDTGGAAVVQTVYAGHQFVIPTDSSALLKTYEADPPWHHIRWDARPNPNRPSGQGGYHVLMPIRPPPSASRCKQWLRAQPSQSSTQVHPSGLTGGVVSGGLLSASAASNEVLPPPPPPVPPVRKRARLDYGQQKDASQIELSTPAGTYLYKFASGNVQTVSVSHNCQHLTAISLEIHANTRGSKRPDPAHDAVQCVVYHVRDDDRVMAGLHDVTGVIMVADEDTPLLSRSAITGHLVHRVASEVALFECLAEVVLTWDPDILVGFDVQFMSWGYLIDRANLGHKLDLCGMLARTPQQGDNKFSRDDDTYGFKKASGIHINGRISLNVWRLMRSELALTSYTYESIAYHILHHRVPKYTHETLTKWYSGSAIRRWRAIQLLLDRAEGNHEILARTGFIERTSELARVFGIDFFSVIFRGSQYRVESMMLRLAKPMNYIAVSPSRPQVVAMAAPECVPLIMEPKSALYTNPVLVLDFQSLYPSMVIAYNFCYSTCLGKMGLGENKRLGVVPNYQCNFSWLKALKDDVYIAPNRVMYVKKKVRVGLLPRLLEEILETRVMIKKSMGEYKGDKALHRLLDHRQLGMKLMANVTFGYTAASFSGRMPCVEIADSIVETGKMTLERAKRHVETAFKAYGAKVVYGDTDSLFVMLPGASKETAFKVGKQIADEVTAQNPKPVKLKFEKVYLPCILASKKRYVGYMYETLDQKEPVFDAKGIETVRRDGCPAVAKMLEKSLRVLFETKNLSSVKTYVQRQWRKLQEGRVSVKDFIIAKEVKLGSYRFPDRQPVALISTRAMAKDPRAEPRYKERVPYVVVYSAPGARLIDNVVTPEELLLGNKSLRLNATYYITKMIIPALDRAFALLGVDVKQWHADMPKYVRSAGYEGPNEGRSMLIDHFYKTTHCLACDALAQRGQHLCAHCQTDPQAATLCLAVTLREKERACSHMNKICYTCTGSSEDVECVSLDCPVFYERVKVVRWLQNVGPKIRETLDQLVNDCL